MELTGDRPPLWLVIALAPLQRVRDMLPVEVDGSSGTWCFDVGDMRLWLNAEVVPEVDDRVARFAENTHVYLVPRLFNVSGSRLV